jgi:hypothetical protein
LCAICSFPSRCGRAGRLAGADHLREHVGLTEDQHLVGADADLRAAVLREDDLVALGDVHLDVLAVLVTGAGANGQDLPALRLLLRRVRKDDPTRRGLLLLEHLDDQTIAKRLQVHLEPPCNTTL